MKDVNIYTQNELISIQKCELEILDKFVSICEKYNLTYFLDGGTLLGAVRHSGFIPWDDDIDVSMPRKDYQKFLKIAQDELGTEYFLQNVFIDKECPFIFSKIRKNNTSFVEWNKYKLNMNHGIYIDVFPFDILPNEEVATFIKKSSKMIDDFYLKFIPKRSYTDKKNIKWILGDIFKSIIFNLSKVLDKLKIAKSIDEYISKYKEMNGKNISYFNAFSIDKKIYEKEILFPVKKIKFESKLYSVPHRYEEYLEKTYGDYMKLPPLEERVGHRPLIVNLNENYKYKK